jgi:twitching motility protein PilT
MDPTRLGQLAMAYGLIDSDQLAKCLRLQERAAPARYLGEVLISEGLLDTQALRRLLSTQRRELERKDPDAAARFERTQIAERLQQADLRGFLEVALETGAEELHLAAGSRPTVRVNGALVSIRPEELTADEAWNLLGSALTDQAWERFRRSRSHHFVHHEENLGRFRASYFFQVRGPSAVFCAIPSTLPPLEELGLPELVKDVPRLRDGLVLVTGPTASGRTTTLAALVELINRRRRRHVVILEDAIEFVHTSRHSLITQREVGQHATDWDTALKACLREDPDVIVLGDLDHPRRFGAALGAAETGHLVIGALHTDGVRQALLSIVQGYVPERRGQVCTSLARVLRFMISQKLIPGQDGRGLQLATEVLRNTQSVALAIQEQSFHQLERSMQLGHDEGMKTQDDDLLRLVLAEQITAGDALARANDRERLFDEIRRERKASS